MKTAFAHRHPDLTNKSSGDTILIVKRKKIWLIIAIGALLLLIAAFLLLPKGNPAKASVEKALGNILPEKSADGSSGANEIRNVSQKKDADGKETGQDAAEDSAGEQKPAGAASGETGQQEQAEICPEYRGLQLVLLSNGFYAISNGTQIMEGWQLGEEVPCFENPELAYTCVGAITKQGKARTITMLFTQNSTFISSSCS